MLVRVSELCSFADAVFLSMGELYEGKCIGTKILNILVILEKK